MATTSNGVNGTSPQSADYLIIGSGIFGASTAYHLIKKWPRKRIVLVDRLPYPCPLAASWDWNKVVRADYGEEFYLKFALEAIDLWRKDPLYKPYYHESGLINIDNTGLGRKIIENYKKIGADVVPEVISPKELIERYGDFHKDTDFTNVEEVYVNKRSGWAQADKALKAIIDASIEAGVVYEEQELSKLIFDDGGRCKGFESKDGHQFTATKTILAAGAETAKILADSAPKRSAMHVGKRITAAAVVVGNTELTPEEAEKYKHIPVNVHAIDPIHGEVMPPTPENDHYNLKWCRDESFKNTVHHDASGTDISMPPPEKGQAQRTPPEGLKQRLETVKKGFMGPHADKYPITSYRVCWDGVTPNQDFIITQHPHSQSLFIAAGGSFHSWKFLPTIGKYVVDCLDGKLDSSLAKRWAWDRSDEGAAHGDLLPTIELADL